MKILTVPNKVLYRQAKPVEVLEPHIQALIDKMFITMYRARGIGLAANQVGVLKQVIVLNTGYHPVVLINPAIRYIDSEYATKKESCLSIPGYTTSVERCEGIYVVSHNRHGKEQNFEAHGLLARCIQHEVDHLNGMLITYKDN